MKTIVTRYLKGRQNGQITVWFALGVLLIFLCLALVIDFGFAYTTRAQLSKAVDAGTLAGVRSLHLGQTAAANLARQTFAANYPNTGRDVSTPVPTITYNTDNANRTVVSVSASTTINTFFMRVIPRWQTLTIATSAQGMRSRLVMSVVLDRSGSMSLNGGGAAMPGAVTTFINLFDDNNDLVSMSSFDHIATVNVPMGNPFKQKIINAVKAFSYDGGTYAHGGLLYAQAQNATIPPTPGQDAVRVAVFFTDGLSNTIEEKFPGTLPTSLLHVGGNDRTTGSIFYFNGVTGAEINPYPKPTKFYSQHDGAMVPLNQKNITDDGEYRCVQVAKAMRQANTIVYSIGLGNNINQDFLKQIANTPDCVGYDPNLPSGLAIFAPTASQLAQAFQTIAANILPRLTQ